jgi:hypothetical protein
LSKPWKNIIAPKTHLAITGTAPPAVVVSFSNIAPSAGLGTGRAER